MVYGLWGKSPHMWGAARFGLALLALASATSPSFAQLDAATAQEGAKGRALLICAVLAAEGTEAMQEKASELAFRGTEASRPTMAAIMQEMSKAPSQGPLNAFITAQDATFLVALSFADATQEVKKLLDEVAPFDGAASYEITKDTREWQAELEFKKRNCGFL